MVVVPFLLFPPLPKMGGLPQLLKLVKALKAMANKDNPCLPA
jgi:hypothetical protein